MDDDINFTTSTPAPTTSVKTELAGQKPAAPVTK